MTMISHCATSTIVQSPTAQFQSQCHHTLISILFLNSILVNIGVYRSTSCLGVEIVITREYLIFLSHLPRCALSFHQPVAGYIAIKLLVAN